jgi:signal peptidase II
VEEVKSERKAPMMKWLWLTVVVIILDLVTKAIASDNLVLYQPVNVFPGFNFTLMHNRGAAFSFLSDAPGWQRWFFSTVAIVVSLVLFIWIMRLQAGQSRLAIALALILGGALGNVWDRLTLGYVIDFIDWYVADAHWPAFNIADSAIFIGAVLLIYDSFRGHKQMRADTET